MSLTTILPDNATALEGALERVLSYRLNGIASPFPSLWRPTEVDPGALPWLAEAVGVSEWNAAASDEEKRASVAAQWPNARQGGMGVALQRAIDPLGLGVRLKPWFESGGAPYSFTIELVLGSHQLDSSLLARCEDRLQSVKSERDSYSVAIVIESAGGATSSAVPAAYFRAAFTDLVNADSLPFANVIESGVG